MKDLFKTEQVSTEEPAASRQKILKLEPVNLKRKQMQHAVRKSEEAPPIPVENANDIVYSLTLDGVCTYVSSNVAELWGYDVSDVENHPFWSFVHPQDLPMFLEFLERSIKTGEKQADIEYRALHKDGRWQWYVTNPSPIYGANCKPVAFMGIARDITDFKQTENAFIAENNFSESILDSMPGVFYCCNDRLQLKKWNNNLERVSGYSAEELSKINPLDFFAGEGRERIERSIKEVFAKGESNAETDFVSKDGRKTPYFFTGLKVAIDNVDHLVGVGIDISQHKQILKEGEQKYRSIFENAVEGIFQSDPDGHILSANPALVSMLGFNSPEELATAMSDIKTPLNRRLLKKYLRLVRREEPIEKFETELSRKDRRIIWVSMNIRAVRDGAGNVCYFVGTMEDITHRKEAAEKLARNMENLRRATTTTIHVMTKALEIRDPYTASHQRRTTDLARTIANEMDLPPNTIESVRMAGIIHDIGKISIPAEILSKPTTLTNVEFELIKIHPECGYSMLKDIESPWPLAEIVLQHHERIDGSGYPQKLKGNQIRIEARIIAIADVVEAISSHRPYRPAKGIDAALEELEKNKGTFYDETVAETCLKLFRKKGFMFKPTES